MTAHDRFVGVVAAVVSALILWALIIRAAISVVGVLS